MFQGLKKLLIRQLLAMVKELKILLLIKEPEENRRGIIVSRMKELICRGGIGVMTIGEMAGKQKGSHSNSSSNRGSLHLSPGVSLLISLNQSLLNLLACAMEKQHQPWSLPKPFRNHSQIRKQMIDMLGKGAFLAGTQYLFLG